MDRNGGFALLRLCRQYEEKAPSETITVFTTQYSVLKVLQKLGSEISFSSRYVKAKNHLAIMVFSDAGLQTDKGLLWYIAWLLVADMRTGSIYHVLYCSSHKTKLPVREINSAEIIYSGEAIDEG